MIEIRRLPIPDVLELTPRRHRDARGFFSEVWSAPVLAAAGVQVAFVQDNHSCSTDAGVLRGLHFQEPPFAQAKLIRVVRGAIFDVAVDIRRGSPTFGDWVGLAVSAEKWNQILVPTGFAHGFVTTEPQTEVLYKVSAPYAPEHERRIRYDDPALAIDWPLDGLCSVLSDKDRNAPLLAEVKSPFEWRLDR